MSYVVTQRLATSYLTVTVSEGYQLPAISGASVTFDGVSKGSTDANGKVRFEAPIGSHKVHVEKSNYYPVDRDVYIVEGENTSDIYMYPIQTQCNNGQEKCVGYDLYICKDHQWELETPNSTRCGYTPPACNEGATKCEGYDKYRCIGGQWVLSEKNSADCGYTPECSPNGSTKCVGYDLYQCANGQWVLAQKNSTSCGYTPPECSTEGATKCVGVDKYTCQSGKWVMTEKNSPSCGYVPPACTTEGAKKCEGKDQYTCQGGKWILTGANSPECGGGGGNWWDQIPGGLMTVGAIGAGVVGVTAVVLISQTGGLPKIGIVK